MRSQCLVVCEACAKSLEQLVHAVLSIKYYAAFNVVCMGSLLCDDYRNLSSKVVPSIKDRMFQSLDLLQLSFRVTLIFMTIAIITKCSVIYGPCIYHAVTCIDWSYRGLGSILSMYSHSHKLCMLSLTLESDICICPICKLAVDIMPSVCRFTVNLQCC